MRKEIEIWKKSGVVVSGNLIVKSEHFWSQISSFCSFSSIWIHAGFELVLITVETRKIC